LAACLVVAIGSFMPWVKVTTVFGTFSRSGTEAGDGAITLVLGIAAASLALIAAGRGLRGYVLPSFIVAMGALALIVGIVDSADVQSKVASVNSASGGAGHAGVGAGLWLVDVASAALVAGAIVLLIAVRRPQTAAPQLLGTAASDASRPSAPAPAIQQLPATQPASAAVIRAWATEHGLEVKPQGPIPKHIREQYAATRH
jgi:hypothetical protein